MSDENRGDGGAEAEVLLACVERGDTEGVRRLLAGGAVIRDTYTHSRQHPICRAAALGFLDILKLLIPVSHQMIDV